MDTVLYMALLHHPVTNKQGEVITTAVTNMDLHDMARLSRTYDLKAFYVVQPIELQRALVKRLLDYWQTGAGGQYNSTRKEAMKRVKLCVSLDEAVSEIGAEGGKPLLVGTSAKRRSEAVGFSELRGRMRSDKGPWLLLFGTGWGVDQDFLDKETDCVLEPVQGLSDYNHLSVRTAAAIILDRLLGDG